MREEVRDRGRLEHMLTAIGNVEEFTKDVSKESFVNSKLLFFAVVKNIEIVGEATYMLTKEYKQSHPSIPWLVIEKMRHVLVHGYYKIKPSQLWGTIEKDIPELKPYIEKYRDELSE